MASKNWGRAAAAGVKVKVIDPEKSVPKIKRKKKKEEEENSQLNTQEDNK